MAIVALVVFFFFLFISTSGQATSSPSGETVWAAVAFLVAGEHTPTLGPWPSSSSSILTPAGAQQMLHQGEAFRTRYILHQDDDDGSSSAVVPRAQIRNISRDALDNAQLSILAAGKDHHVVAGALAFMQGLYPAANAAASSTISLDAVAGGVVVEYPLGGYQYPVIRTAGVLDEESIYVQGHVGCTSWENFTDVYTKPENMRTYSSLASEFSQLILAHDTLTGIIPFEAANFWNAYDVWTAVDYQYRHNQTVHDGFGEWNATLRDEFKGYALLEQLARNSDGSISNDPLSGERERLIPGRTLAKQILTALRTRLAAAAAAQDDDYNNDGDEQLLTLMFGSIEPVMSFAALANLTGTNSSPSSSQFLPEAGSALIFELFSTVESSSSTTKIPDTDDLFIRAYFRPGTNNASDEFEPRRLFSSNKDDNSMPFVEFAQRMMAIEYDIWTWCDACRANTPFCRGRRDAGGVLTDGHQGEDPFASHARGGVSAVAAGVIGAMVTFAVVGLAMVVAVVVGGVRVSRAVPGERGKRHAEKGSPDTEFQDGSHRGGGGGGSSVSSVASPGIGHETGVLPASVSGIHILERGMVKAKVKGEQGLWFKGDDDGDDRDDHVLREIMGMKPIKPHDVV